MAFFAFLIHCSQILDTACVRGLPLGLEGAVLDTACLRGLPLGLGGTITGIGIGGGSRLDIIRDVEAAEEVRRTDPEILWKAYRPSDFLRI
jgi:hypothetical protein